MDLLPSSYNDYLEELWDEEEEPEEVKTVLKAVMSVYHQYLDSFSKVKSENIPPHHTCDHHIELEQSLPPVGVIYSLSNQESDTLRAYISENKDGGLRLCVDYRKLNAVTRKNEYPVPPMNQLLNVFNGFSIFSKIDLHGAYNIPRIKEGDEHLTAVRTKYGSYRYLVMPFGLTNAPASFQNLEEHVTHVSTVLSRLRANNIAAKASKCLFYVSSVEYLGYVVSSEGIKMDQEKVQKILSWPLQETSRLLNLSLALPISTAVSSIIIQKKSVHSPVSPSMRKLLVSLINSKRLSPPLQSFSTHHLFKKQEYSSQEVWIPQTSSNSKWSVDLSFNGLHHSTATLQFL
ncbi:hypothetical protein O181_025861 [Austropuccinia psidii MF-1]|uniref:Reverse transcriptase domain-containing protein n=1 Tax=Austropuccinia psidii MF-1 TaxID=1389203 RepID=A0A9Q3GZZ3_9BASI|nr:hypothetical protein [Austropuccinia psidii MF-1]